MRVGSCGFAGSSKKSWEFGPRPQLEQSPEMEVTRALAPTPAAVRERV
jgi:hypothetical protein